MKFTERKIDYFNIILGIFTILIFITTTCVAFLFVKISIVVAILFFILGVASSITYLAIISYTKKIRAIPENQIKENLYE